MLKKNIYPISALILILISWFTPPFAGFWKTLDHASFLFLNNALIPFPELQRVIAWMNSRYADWLYEGIVISVYIGHLIYGDRKKRSWQLATVILTIVFTQVVINKLIFFKCFGIVRFSPSLILEHPVDLSIFPYLNNKTGSSHSFPADHATTLFLVSFFAWSHFRKGIAISISALSFIMILPRLISGAHWLSDVIFGAFYIAIIGWSAAQLLTQKLTKP